VPTAPEDIIDTGLANATAGVYVDMITVVNPTASPVTFFINDKQSVPKPILNITVAANTTHVAKMWGYWAPGGLRWGAGTNNVLIGSVRFMR
jgi:hypothetical protein